MLIAAVVYVHVHVTSKGVWVYEGKCVSIWMLAHSLMIFVLKMVLISSDVNIVFISNLWYP